MTKDKQLIDKARRIVAQDMRAYDSAIASQHSSKAIVFHKPDYLPNTPNDFGILKHWRCSHRVSLNEQCTKCQRYDWPWNHCETYRREYILRIAELLKQLE